MSEKKEITLSLSTVFLIIAIILIVIMGIIIFYLYNTNQKLSTKTEETNSTMSSFENSVESTNNISNTPDTNSTIIQNQVEELDINDATVKKLYNYVLKCDDFDGCFADSNNSEPASFYKSSKTTYSSLSDIEKVLTTLKNYSDAEIKSTNKSQVKNIIDVTHAHDSIKIYENFNAKVKEIFNQSDIKGESYTGLAEQLEYKNGCYYLLGFDGGGLGTTRTAYSKIQKAEKNQEFLYIYDKYIYIDSWNYYVNEGDQKVHVYTESDEKNDIGTEKEDPDKIENLYNKYENKLKTYKHTFKQNEDGSYYWVSSEIYQ